LDRTPLYLAVLELPEVVPLLLEKGANPNFSWTNSNQEKLYILEYFLLTPNCSKEIVGLLLAYGAFVTPHALMVGINKPFCMELFAERGVDLNQPYKGVTPIENIVTDYSIWFSLPVLKRYVELGVRFPNPLFYFTRPHPWKMKLELDKLLFLVEQTSVAKNRECMEAAKLIQQGDRGKGLFDQWRSWCVEQNAQFSTYFFFFEHILKRAGYFIPVEVWSHVHSFLQCGKQLKAAVAATL
jgi:hypothetical protein